MRWSDADVFLKVLEEPPESATLILLAPNPNLLLPTILSRCMQFFFAPLSLAELEHFLKERTKLKAPERKLAAQLADGCPGVALRMDLEESVRLRREVVRLVELAAEGKSFGRVFAQTTQLAKNERERFENILELFYSVCHDLLELSHGPQEPALRNPDLKRELEALSQRTSLEWVRRVVGELDQLHGRLRRNINRQLGLDALAVVLGGR
jgi:DNA polymerase-3 subunit delta'